MTPEPPYPTVDLKPYKFVDFGCSAGGSIAWAMERFGAARGLGIDINPDKVARTREAGFEAMLADATRLDQFEGRVRFTTMIHFLEHLPSFDAARQVVTTALSISRDFLYIRQPWFDSDGPLLRQGLKLYWSHWRGHPLPMTSLQMYALFYELGLTRKCARFAIFGKSPITSSDSKAVLPLSAKWNTHHYDEAEHGPKPSAPLEGVFTEIVAVAAPRNPEALNEAMDEPGLTLLFDSGALRPRAPAPEPAPESETA